MRARHRVVLTVADQYLSSAQNFMILILAARTSSAKEFGAFTLALAILTLAVAFNQAVVAEPLVLSTAGSSAEEARQHARSARAASLVIVLCLSALLLCVGAVMPAPSVRTTLFMCAVALPALVVLDMGRWTAVALRRPTVLLAIDACWVSVWLVSVLVFRPHGAVQHLLCWAFSAIGGAALAVVVTGVPVMPRAARPIPWLKQHRRASTALATEFVATNGSAQIVSIMVAGMVGLASSGGLRAAQGLFGPINSLINATRLGVVPELIRAGGSRTRRGRMLLRATGAVMLAVTGAAAAGALALPRHWGVQLFGATWPGLRDVLLPVAVGRMFGAAQMRPLLALRADLRLDALARLRVLASAAVVLAAAIGALSAGVQGAAWGMAFASLLSYLGFAWAARDAATRRDVESAPHAVKDDSD